MMRTKLRYMLLLTLAVSAALWLAACGTGGNSTGTAAEGSASPAASAVISPPTEGAKIASMSIHVTNNLLALGLKPAGSVIGGDVKDFLPHVADRLEGTTKLGVISDPDLEAVLALKPDVIYTDSSLGGNTIPQLEKIAPTYSIDMDEGTWRDHLNRLAEYVGKQGEAKAFIDEYEVKAKEVGELIKSKLGQDAKVMAIRSTPKELRVMGMKRPVGPLLYQDLGLKPADGVEKIADEPYAVISQEMLPDFNADAIFVIISTGTAAKGNFEELQKSAIWKNLKAVQNNHVYLVNGPAWLDYSAIGQRMALDDAAQLFSK